MCVCLPFEDDDRENQFHGKTDSQATGELWKVYLVRWELLEDCELPIDETDNGGKGKKVVRMIELIIC